jgi:hypothetical protein
MPSTVKSLNRWETPTISYLKVYISRRGTEFEDQVDVATVGYEDVARGIDRDISWIGGVRGSTRTGGDPLSQVVARRAELVHHPVGGVGYEDVTQWINSNALGTT